MSLKKWGFYKTEWGDRSHTVGRQQMSVECISQLIKTLSEKSITKFPDYHVLLSTIGGVLVSGKVLETYLWKTGFVVDIYTCYESQ